MVQNIEVAAKYSPHCCCFWFAAESVYESIYSKRRQTMLVFLHFFSGFHKVFHASGLCKPEGEFSLQEKSGHTEVLKDLGWFLNMQVAFRNRKALC